MWVIFSKLPAIKLSIITSTHSRGFCYTPDSSETRCRHIVSLKYNKIVLYGKCYICIYIHKTNIMAFSIFAAIKLIKSHLTNFIICQKCLFGYIKHFTAHLH